MFQSNSRYYVKSTITATQGVWTTFLLSTDFELWANLETWTDTVSIVLKNWVQIERFEITATLWTATIVKRWITQGNPLATDVWLQKQWADWTIAYVTALAYDIIDKQWDTMEWPLTFQPLSTAERTALTPSNGSIVYDTDLWVLYQFIWGAWASFASWTTPFASATVAWKVEIATQWEVDAWTDTWGSWAIVSVIPSTFNTWITNKLASQAEAEAGASNTKLMTPLRVAQYCPTASTTVAGKVEMATDWEATTWTDETRYINPKQAKDNYWAMEATASDTLQASADTERTVEYTTGNYVKTKEIQLNQISNGGIARIKFDLKDARTTGAIWRIYINWIAVWTERTTALGTYTTYSEDLPFENWDLIQLYIKTVGIWVTSVTRNFRIYYTKSSLEQIVINLD